VTVFGSLIQSGITRTFLSRALLLSGWWHVMLSWLSLRAGSSSSKQSVTQSSKRLRLSALGPPDDEAYCA
jgi:hypothetical protein